MNLEKIIAITVSNGMMTMFHIHVTVNCKSFITSNKVRHLILSKLYQSVIKIPESTVSL